ncbi:MAG: UDP-N-acetylmuramoyl-L-alanyl-D-glutamate--2,6-diaminopimelate ligase [Acidobacteriota bacterium]
MPAVAGNSVALAPEDEVTHFSALVASVQGTRAGQPGDPVIEGIAFDSRRVQPGHLFVALPGRRTNGLDFLPEAISRGAVAVLAQSAPPAGGDLPWVQVPDARAAMAAVARAFHGAPDDDLMVAGITGTNGKTSTAILLAAACEAAGRPAGLVGTLGSRLGGGFRPGPLTTPEAPDLYALLDEMRSHHRKAAILEVSSIALEQKRVEGLAFDLAVFTNLTRDHLDFHRNMNHYFAAKASLFAGLPPHAATAVNLDDPFGTRLLSPSRPRVVTYGRTTRADLFPTEFHATSAGLCAVLHTPAGSVKITSRLLGLANLYNILAAMAAAHALDLDLQRAAQGIASIHEIPGRAQRIDAGQDFTVLVDYAHTDDALVSILEVARSLTDQRVVVVFGCGGDRDRTKRPLMGGAAARLADRAILTTDNPRGEDPGAILDEISAGFREARGPAVLLVEPDRAAAIHAAIQEARPGDVVVIAGKGHENEQILGDHRIPFDDREVVRQALRSRLGKGA